MLQHIDGLDVGRSGATLMPDNTFEVRSAFVGSLHGYAAELVTRQIAGLLKMPCLHETLDSGRVAERRYGLERAASGDFIRRMRYASTLPLPKSPSPRRPERVPLVALLSRALATFEADYDHVRSGDVSPSLPVWANCPGHASWVR